MLFISKREDSWELEKCPICSSKFWGLQRGGCKDLQSNEASQARNTPVVATTPVALHLVLPGIYTLVSTENHSEERKASLFWRSKVRRLNCYMQMKIT